MPYFLSRKKGGSGYSSGRRSSTRITIGGSSRHSVRVYEDDEDPPRNYVERDRGSRRSTGGDRYYATSFRDSRRDDHRAYDMSSMREALPSYGYNDDYKKRDKPSSRRPEYEYYDEVDDYPTTSKSRQPKYYYEEVDDYPEEPSKSRRPMYEYYDEVDDYPSTSSISNRRNDPTWREEVYPSTASMSNRYADPTWREEISASDYQKQPIYETSSKSMRTSDSEYLRRNFENEFVEGTVEAFLERDEYDEPDEVSGTFRFRRKRN